MTLLSAADLAQIKVDVRGIVEDISVNTTLKYRQYVGEDYFDPKNQQWAENTYTNWSGVSALKGMATYREAGGNVEIGDVKFVIMQSDVSNAISVSDLVVESGATYNVKRSMKDPLNIVYILFVELAT